jgi:phage FluMu gp28-like protein
MEPPPQKKDETVAKSSDSKYFMGYQAEWLADHSDVKIWEKSRRIGATYVQSYEDTREAAQGLWDVWFSSADESAAREYIGYCEKWAKLFDKAARSVGQVVLDSDRNIKAFVIEFASGKKIHALSSNPKAFRSKGGKVVLDEFAWHEDPEKMWAAARPCITWGFPLRILSTHNGKSCLYYKFIERVKKKQLNWSLHTTDIFKAVEDGLVDRILRRIATEQEKQKWLKEQHDNCVDENTWLQEYCCVAVDEAAAFLTYEMLDKIERDGLLMLLEKIAGDLYVGVDIGRKKNLTVIWGDEKVGLVLYTRICIVLPKTKFEKQKQVLWPILGHRTMRRACIDATGLGMQLAEEAVDKFGKFRVEPVTFTNAVKSDIAHTLYTYVEDVRLYVPSDPEIREDLHSVKKIVTAAGNIRFDAANTEDSHADRFWACGLAVHAAHDSPSGPIEDDVGSRGRRESAKILEGYYA